MTKPLIQIGDDVREMTDEEFAELLELQNKAAQEPGLNRDPE